MSGNGESPTPFPHFNFRAIPYFFSALARSSARAPASMARSA